ncbi:hypothetical protein GQ42DRAFT_38383 [Ramicandelaber brevisporus]|nr:hypothetical protein GQ42DRAFT_38383 [Ramicandelaber brevisporus]
MESRVELQLPEAASVGAQRSPPGLLETVKNFLSSPEPGVAKIASYIQTICVHTGGQAGIAARLLNVIVDTVTTPHSAPAGLHSLTSAVQFHMLRVDPLTLPPVISALRTIICQSSETDMLLLVSEFQYMVDAIQEHVTVASPADKVEEPPVDGANYHLMSRTFCRAFVASSVLSAAALTSEHAMRAYGLTLAHSIGLLAAHYRTLLSDYFQPNIFNKLVATASHIDSGLGAQVRAALAAGFQQGADSGNPHVESVVFVARELLSCSSTSTASLHTWVRKYLNRRLQSQSLAVASEQWRCTIKLIIEYFLTHSRFHPSSAALSSTESSFVLFILRALNQHPSSHYIFRALAQGTLHTTSLLHPYTREFIQCFRNQLHCNSNPEAQFNRFVFLADITLHTSLFDDSKVFLAHLETIACIFPSEVSTFTISDIQHLFHQLRTKSPTHRTLVESHFTTCFLTALYNPHSYYHRDFTSLSAHNHKSLVIKQSLQLLPTLFNDENIASVATEILALQTTTQPHMCILSTALLESLTLPNHMCDQHRAIFRFIELTSQLHLFQVQEQQRSLVSILVNASNFNISSRTVALAAISTLTGLITNNILNHLDMAEYVAIIQATVGNVIHFGKLDTAEALTVLELLAVTGTPSPAALAELRLPPIYEVGFNGELFIAQVVRRNLSGAANVRLVVALSTTLTLLYTIEQPLPVLHPSLRLHDLVNAVNSALHTAFHRSSNERERAAIVHASSEMRSSLVSTNISIDPILGQEQLQSTPQPHLQPLPLVNFDMFWKQTAPLLYGLHSATSTQLSNLFHVFAIYTIQHSPAAAVYNSMNSNSSQHALLYHLFPVAALSFVELADDTLAPLARRISFICLLLRQFVSAPQCPSQIVIACIRYCQLALSINSPASSLSQMYLPLDCAAEAARRCRLVGSEISLRQAARRVPGHFDQSNDTLLLAAKARNGCLASRSSLCDYIMQMHEDSDIHQLLQILDVLTPADQAFEAILRSVLGDIVAHPAFAQPHRFQQQSLFLAPTPPEVDLSEEHFVVAIHCLNRVGRFDASRMLIQRMLPWYHLRLPSETLFDCAIAALAGQDSRSALAIVQFLPENNMHAAVIRCIAALGANDLDMIPDLIQSIREQVVADLRQSSAFSYAGVHPMLQLLGYLHEIEVSAQEPAPTNIASTRAARDSRTQLDNYQHFIVNIIRSSRS